MSTFSNRLRKCRDIKKQGDDKWTQAFVAQLVNITRGSYTSYENGSKNPPYDVLIKLADLYDVDIDFLLGRKDIPKGKYVYNSDLLNKINRVLWELPEKDQKKIYKFIKLFFYDE